MSPDSITERQTVRSLHFELNAKDEALRQTKFYREQLFHYLDAVFKTNAAYQVEHVERSETDSIYTIRKGSAVLSLETVFGRNTSYKEQPPRHFYTFTATASHRNETLDQTDKVNDVIEWCCKITGGIVVGLVAAIGLALLTGYISGYITAFAFAGGAALGSIIGQKISEKIYRAMERRLEAKGEVTAIEEEWAQLEETLGLVFDAEKTVAQ